MKNNTNSESLKKRYQERVTHLRPLFPHIEDFIFEEILECYRSVRFQLRVRVHKGPSQHLWAYIALHANPYNTGEDPYKGGLKKTTSVNQEDIEGHSMIMSVKTGLFDLRLGGGKSGIVLREGYHYTLQDHAEINRAFVVAADGMGLIGPRIYSTATDQGVSEFDMDCIAREYIKIHEKELGSKSGVATGKSIEEGGHPARKFATGRGGLIVLKKALAYVKKESLKSIIIDGFGNVGLPTFILAKEYGFRVNGVCDKAGGIYNSHGLDIESVIAHYKETESFAGYKGADAVSSSEILELPCDILIPAAAPNRLTETNAKNVKAKFIHELANGPTTTEGDRIFQERGIPVTPDALGGGGGVVISWRELNINKEHDRHSVELRQEENEANKILKNIMEENAELIFKIAEQKKLGLRDATFYLALSRMLPRLQKKHIRFIQK